VYAVPRLFNCKMFLFALAPDWILARSCVITGCVPARCVILISYFVFTFNVLRVLRNGTVHGEPLDAVHACGRRASKKLIGDGWLVG
jgi:hypothetical protein